MTGIERVNDNVTLKEYIERIFDEREKALNQAFRAQQEALALATHSLELRLEKLNELRAEVITDRAKYATTDKFDTELGRIDDLIQVTKDALVAINLQLQRDYMRKDTLDSILVPINNQLSQLNEWRNQVIGFGIAFSLLACIVGGFLARHFGF